MQGASLILTQYQHSLTRAMDITANNIANVNTTGFKRESVAFDTYLARPEPKHSLQFAVESNTYRDTAAGPSLITGNSLDVAIQGKGYIPIETPEGVRYTRAGAFQLNNDGDLVTGDGNRVLGDGNQTITFPPDAREILIAPDGTVSAMVGAGSDASVIGKLTVVSFEHEEALTTTGNGLYAAEETPEPTTEARLVQGSIEQSNVQAVVEMTRMIEVSRAYQRVVHLWESENERQNKAIQRLGKATA